MNKNLRSYVYTILICAILSFAVFAVAYVLLSKTHIESENTEILKTYSESALTEFDDTIIKDYNYTKQYIETIKGDINYSNEDLFNLILTRNRIDLERKFKFQTDLLFGYFNEKSYKFYLENENGEINEYPIYASGYYEYHQKNVAFYSFDIICQTINDKTEYVVYRVGDIFVYFKAHDYLNKIYRLFDGLDSTYFIIFEQTGNVNFQSNKTERTGNLKQTYIDPYNDLYNYSIISEALYDRRIDSDILKFDGVKSYFVYCPLLEGFDNDMCLGFVFKYSEVKVYNEYLNAILISLGGLSVVVVTLIVAIFGFGMYKRNQDITDYHKAYYYVKPFTIYINRNGRILRKNKSFEKNINNFDSYTNVTQFKILEKYTDTLDIIKKQDNFLVEFETDIYDDKKLIARFTPLKVFKKYVLVGNNVTKEHKEMVFNANIAQYNQVTNLPNRNILDKDIIELFRTPEFDTTYNSFVGFDLLDFNKINKLYGYESANIILRNIAAIIDQESKKIHQDFILYNIRTSYFIVYFRKVPNYNMIVSWSREIVEKLSEPIEVKDNFYVQVEPRIGVLNITQDIIDKKEPHKIYDYLTESVNRAKISRLSKVSMYNSELSIILTRDQLMEEDLKDAIKNDEFMMYFQPQFNTETNRIIGFEALLKWNNPKYIYESPEHYVTIAEKDGLIVDLGRLITNKVFDFAKRVEGTGISVSLNVSPVQLLQKGFVNDLLKSYNERHLKENTIAIEITETFLMENIHIVVDKLKILKEHGFVIHLDDFGEGYSSMLYLKDLPVDAIKIDKEFTKSMMTDKTTKVIVSKIIQIGNSLNLEVICEGVETTKQSEVLLKMGSNIIQGYLISKPVPLKDALDLIEKYNHPSIEMMSKMREDM